jgi:hypothetical protein
MSAKKKFDWNILLTAISVVIAIISIIVAVNANRISLASQLPKIQINNLGGFRAYDDDYKRPCLSDFNGVYWYVESANGFDITNSGGKAVSLVNVEGSDIETLAKGISPKVDFEVFGTKENFDQWLSTRPSTYLFVSEQKNSQFEYSGFPIDIDSGKTVRLVLLGKHSVAFDDTYKNSLDIQRVLDGSDWKVKITFTFGDGTKISNWVHVTYPYQFDPILTPQEFKKCEK